tara:strand:- start:55 stop:270 length:216 start_codon:yes stop_codon:yes gene_type:complete
MFAKSLLKLFYSIISKSKNSIITPKKHCNSYRTYKWITSNGYPEMEIYEVEKCGKTLILISSLERYKMNIT